MNATNSDSAILDTKHLGKYTLGDYALECEILNMFIDQSATYMKRLETPASTKDWSEAAHSLKGCARGIGAFKVGMRAAQLEKIHEPLQGTVRYAILTLLRDDLDKTKTEILSYLDLESTAVFL